MRDTEEDALPTYSYWSWLNSLSEIMEELDMRINDWEKTKRAIFIALWKRLFRARGEDTHLLYGTAGYGKSALVGKAAGLIKLPFLSCDATSLNEPGYRGRDYDRNQMFETKFVKQVMKRSNTFEIDMVFYGPFCYGISKWIFTGGVGGGLKNTAPAQPFPVICSFRHSTAAFGIFLTRLPLKKAAMTP